MKRLLFLSIIFLFSCEKELPESGDGGAALRTTTICPSCTAYTKFRLPQFSMYAGQYPPQPAGACVDGGEVILAGQVKIKLPIAANTSQELLTLKPAHRPLVMVAVAMQRVNPVVDGDSLNIYPNGAVVGIFHTHALPGSRIVLSGICY